MIEVYAFRANTEAAAALVAKLRAEGRNAREQNSQYFDHAQVDKGAVKVYHDGGTLVIPHAYGKLGVECELIPGLSVERGAETATEPVLAPEVVEPADEAPAPTGGFRVEQAGTWYSLIGPDGEKVGKSQRSEEEAWAQAAWA